MIRRWICPMMLCFLTVVGTSWGKTIRAPEAFASIQEAIDAAAEGDTVLVAPGVYEGAISIGARGVVLLASGMTYEERLPSREDVARTVLDGGGADFVIRIGPEGGSVTVRGFTIRNADDGIMPERPFTLTHCRVTETSDGVDYEGGGGLIEYCYFDHNRDDGIDLDGPVATVIRYCDISDNRDDGIEIRFQPFEGDSLHTVIFGNAIARNGEDGIQFIDYETATPRSFLIVRNVILNNAMAGIGFMGNANTRENFEGDAVDESVRIAHNTLVGNPYGIAGGGNVQIVNTIIAQADTLGLKNAAPPAVVSHVLLFGNGRDAENTPLDGTVIVGVDPLFAEDFHLSAASPAIDRGMVRDGTAFAGRAPDLGAREFWAPAAVTDSVSVDSDDPAIWIDRAHPERSRILGTDKGGRVYVFDLSGKTERILQMPGMKRMNNIDVAYDVKLGGGTVDVAVATDRDAGLLFVWSLPDGKPLVKKGVSVFKGEKDRRPMGVALYKRPRDGAVFAIVSRKSGPSGSYLWQYRLEDAGNGTLGFRKVRAFGAWSGVNAAGDGEIEAICVDDAAGVVYYSDELFGIRKYHADPDHPEAKRELDVFGQSGFADDREGIAIARQTDGSGLLIVSDQGGHRFRAFDLAEGHRFLGSVALGARSTDGCEVYAEPLPGYPTGLFVVMSDDRTFQLYHWGDVLAGLRESR